MFIHHLSKFGKFSLKIVGEIICQSWLLLTPFFNLTIVQCFEDKAVFDKKQFVHPQYMKRRWASERWQSDALGMDDVDIRHGTSVRPEQHVCPQAQHDSVIANQPLHPITNLVNTDVNDNNNNNPNLVNTSPSTTNLISLIDKLLPEKFQNSYGIFFSL